MSEEKGKYTVAQKAARKRQDAKRRGDKRIIPTIRLNDEEARLADAVFEAYAGQKKKAVLDGLALLIAARQYIRVETECKEVEKELADVKRELVRLTRLYDQHKYIDAQINEIVEKYKGENEC